MADRLFPILRDEYLKALPWSMLSGHEAQAKTNHGGQSLERLASRGGLSVVEAWHIFRDRPMATGAKYNVPVMRAMLMRDAIPFTEATHG